MSWKRGTWSAIALLAAMGCGGASAVEPIVLLKGEGQTISSVDVAVDAERIPENMRNGFLAKPQSTLELANNLYIRRVMAAKGKAAGLEQSPEVQAAVQLATDKILSDAYLLKFNADHVPDAKVVEAQARSKYKAHPEEFLLPEQAHALHILIMGKGDKTEARAQAVLAELKNGADFSELAKKHSDDAASGARGGDLGYFAKGKMVPEFEKAAFAMKRGETSGLVKTAFGYHVIRLIDLKPSYQQTYDEVADELKKKITADMQGKARADAVQQVKASVVVDQPAIEAFSKRYEKK